MTATDPARIPLCRHETDEVRMELQPVVDLALWANNAHRPVHQTCLACGTRGCDPYWWSHQILATVATFPIVRSQPTKRVSVTPTGPAGIGDIRGHLPVRPGWACALDGEPWPCLPARHSLTDAHRGNPDELTAQFLGLLIRAAEDLRPTDPTRLYPRFVAWALPKDGACRVCGRANHDAHPLLPPRFIPCDVAERLHPSAPDRVADRGAPHQTD